MSEPAARADGARRHRLRERIGELDPSLVVLAEGVLGLEARIDLVARDGEGRAVALRWAEPGADLAALAELLAQRAWLEPRLADWVQLAPDLGIRPGGPVRAVLLAERFDPRTRAAARGLPGAPVELVEVRELPARETPGLALHPLEPGPQGPARLGPRARFRSGLRPEEVRPAGN